MPQSVIYKEKYGSSGPSSIYVRNTTGGGSKVVQLSHGLATPPQRSLKSSFVNFLSEVFLPQGYPECVRDDYCSYQVWDTMQAFCSTISGILTTHAIMKSVGVGDAAATALSATMTWVLKDGVGMIGRIMFAWWKGHALDTDSKKWRLFADFLNDAAMFLELLLLPMCPHYPTQILCLTTSMKGIVGVAAGASRASITQHHAIRGNNGDVSAKDGSQETCVNLVASTVGMTVLSYTENDKVMIWALFSFVTLLHLYANFKAVKSLGLVTFNSERLNRYLRKNLVTRIAYGPKEVNKWESVIVGRTYRDKDLCDFNIKLGYSLRHLVESNKISSDKLLVMADTFKHRPYLLYPNIQTRTIYVLLQSDVNTEHILQAYFHSIILALTICCMKNVKKDIFGELNQNSILNKIIQDVNILKKSASTDSDSVLDAAIISEDLVSIECQRFINGIKMLGWSTDCHSLEVDEWRGEWKDSDFSETFKDK